MDLSPTLVRRETSRRLRRVRTLIGEDIRRMRLDANVSVAELSRATEVTAGHLWRIEAGQANPSMEVMTAVGVALGADLGVRYFPGSGPRIHDRFQALMVEALIRALDPRWRVQLEVPVTKPARGVIDAVLHDATSPLVVATEVQSDLHRLEQQLRWGHEKAQGLATLHSDGARLGGPRVSELLVLRSTTRTRELARQFEATLQAAFPARSADAIAALTTPEARWPGPAVVWIHLHGTRASLMHFPPRGVSFGR
jgi:transcriptional regulator with XRE-family HTH domain